MIRVALRHGPVALAVGLVLGLGALSWAWTVDDAYIVARYAARLASGRGYTMNDGPPTDGVTSPLWLGWVALGTILGLDPIQWAKGCGVAAAAVAVGLAVAHARRRALGSRGAWLAAVFVGPQSALSVWSVAGLETGLATCALVVTALGGTTAAAIAGFSVAWLRPECVPAAVVLAFGAPREHRVARLVAVIAGVVAVALFRWVMFGDPVPLSMHAKPAEVGLGLAYVAMAVVALTGIGWCVPIAIRAKEGRRIDRVIALGFVVHLAAVAIAGGDWMPSYRLLVPMLPLLACVVASALTPPTRVARWAVLVAAAVGLSVVTLDAVVQIPRAQRAAELQAQRGTALVAAVEASGGPVALIDVGLVGYRTNLEIVDLGGVTDPSVAHAPGAYLEKVIDDGYLERRAPQTIVLHSSRPPRVGAAGELLSLHGYGVERRLARSAWVRARFVVADVILYSDGYFYVVLTRGGPAEE